VRKARRDRSGPTAEIKNLVIIDSLDSDDIGLYGELEGARQYIECIPHRQTGSRRWP